MELHLVVPDTIGDPSRPSGGNVYDAEVALALDALGVRVVQHPAPGRWPGHGDHSALGRVLAEVPGGAVVVVDGLVGSAAAGVLAEARRRLTVLLLVHLPLGMAATASPAVVAEERRALRAVAGVVTTSGWTRDWLATTYGIGSVRVAHPGVHRGPLARRGTGGSLLCVGAVLPAKGQDVLLDALSALRDLAWTCRVVGPVDRDPAFVRALEQRLREGGLDTRVLIRGTVPHAGLSTEYAATDLLVQPTRLETYGMATTEALAHGVPVVASDTGGVAEALGCTSDGQVPGLLVPPGDPGSLANALRVWLTDPDLRDGLRAAAAARRDGVAGWESTAQALLDAVEQARLNRTALPAVVRS